MTIQAASASMIVLIAIGRSERDACMHAGSSNDNDLQR